MKTSWVRLYHATLDSAVMQDDWHFRLFVWCLLKANYQPVSFQGTTIQPGQFVTGRITGADALNVSASKFYRGLQTLQDKYGSIKLEANSKWTTVTVCNWKTYQYEFEESEQHLNNERTAFEQQVNSQRTADEHNLRIKETKKDRNIEKKEGTPRAAFVPPTVDEVGKFCAERNNAVDAQVFVDHYTSNGWMVGKNKMKDWKASVRTWEKRDESGRGNTNNARGNGGKSRADHANSNEIGDALARAGVT